MPRADRLRSTLGGPSPFPMSTPMTQDTSRRWQMLAIAAVIVYLIWLLAPVLMPFAIAAMLAYLGDPLADRLERLGLNRMWAATIVFVVLLVAVVGVLLLLVPLIARQVENLIDNLPRYGDWAQNDRLAVAAGASCTWIRTLFDSDRLMAGGQGAHRLDRRRGDRGAGQGLALRAGHGHVADQPGADPGGGVLPAARLGPDGGQDRPHAAALDRADHRPPGARVGQDPGRLRARPAAGDAGAGRVLRRPGWAWSGCPWGR